jgi:hypothetical protein
MFNSDLETTKLELSRAEQGMRSPTIAVLKQGDVIFRFASTRKPTTGNVIPSNEWAQSGWWLQELDYRLILERYHAGHLGLGTVAGSAGAVQPSWSLRNVSIKARLLDDIKVYVGPGLPQYRDQLPNGMYVTQKGWPDITQVYIPGMRGPSLNAIHIIRQKIITTDTFGYSAD